MSESQEDGREIQDVSDSREAGERPAESRSDRVFRRVREVTAAAGGLTDLGDSSGR